MKTIPILHIAQFEQEESLEGFYSNDLKRHLKKNETLVHKPHRHDFFLCVLFIKGSGTHDVDFNRYVVEPGGVFFLMPGQTHHWTFDSEPEGYIFFHSQDFYEFYFSNKKLRQFPFYYSYKNPPSLTLPLHELVVLEARFKEINSEYYQNSIYNRQKIASLINLVYIDLSRLYVSLEPLYRVSSSAYLRILAEFENVVEQFYGTEKSAKFYADKLNVTPNHLNRISKTMLNKTTTDVITERVILEAKRLMVHSENSLSTIAENLGYEDYTYFSRVFKLKTHKTKTPLEFKKIYS